MIKVRDLQCESIIAFTILASTTVLPSDTTFIDAGDLLSTNNRVSNYSH
jgi:hypothetical protein